MKRRKDSWWKRIQAKLDIRSNEISVSDRKGKGELKSEQNYRAQKGKYNIDRKGPKWSWKS